jgi:hypothetical protein
MIFSRHCGTDRADCQEGNRLVSLAGHHLSRGNSMTRIVLLCLILLATAAISCSNGSKGKHSTADRPREADKSK